MDENQHNYIVIMAGGLGSRLWPLSRQKKPKQFVDVLGIGKTLIQLAYERSLALCPKENIYIVSNVEYEEMIKAQIDIKDNQLLLEPEGRDTAPCIAFASYKIRAIDPKANLIIKPADHIIFDEHIFFDIVNTGLSHTANTNDLVTIGIKPHKPETGYGYIQFETSKDSPINKVKTFTEKPKYDLAIKFFESGEYLWNTGIFIWNVNTIIACFEKFIPDLAEDFEKGNQFWFTNKEYHFLEDIYAKCQKESIDYAILEKANNVKVICGEFSWSDLGSWESLHDAHEVKDVHDNSLLGNIIAYNTASSHVRSCDEKKLIIVDGLSNYLVIDTKDVLVICPKDDEKTFRKYVADIKKMDNVNDNQR